ncbi:unnamed protein product [Hydatigera taeniaeformis]|uniref:G_PROTEIN_RECEP_F1_2 domain-containing protein n=1 Tax=Hydatigena taeniaeformis TaxID=6205 RepID=A0A0R3XCK7_HYDTA|nr:unnamed protein product [Hydatigera taeniaeformis]
MTVIYRPMSQRERAIERVRRGGKLLLLLLLPLLLLLLLLLWL